MSKEAKRDLSRIVQAATKSIIPAALEMVDDPQLATGLVGKPFAFKDKVIEVEIGVYGPGSKPYNSYHRGSIQR